MKIYFATILGLLTFSVNASDQEVDCNKAISTIEINYCLGKELEIQTKKMEHYLNESFKHNSHDSELVESIKAAQKLWDEYSSAHCDSIYTMWREGSIRNTMAITCQTKLTKKRTHEIWENFLTYMDSTPPVLPEP